MRGMARGYAAGDSRDRGGAGLRGRWVSCWAAGAGPGDAPFTIDLDSTICETYGLAKEGARHHGYTGKRGYHPLLAIAAGTGDVLMSRLREGRANTARGAAHFLRETVGRVRYAGANGRLTLRADSGFYTHGVVSVCRKMDVRFSITIRQHKSLRNLIEAIPEDAWTPIPYWMDGAADVAETTCTPFQSEPATSSSSVAEYGTPCRVDMGNVGVDALDLELTVMTGSDPIVTPESRPATGGAPGLRPVSHSGDDAPASDWSGGGEGLPEGIG